MGNEILSSEGVKVLRPDAEELLEIRNGKYTYEQLIEQVNIEQAKMDELYKAPNIQNTVDLNVADSIVQVMYEMAWQT